MEITIEFGRRGLNLALPENLKYEVLRAHATGALANPTLAIERALETPVAGLALRKLARGRKTAAISVCDITRPAPNPLTLPPILNILHEAGMRDQDITLCIATGLHRQATRSFK